MQSLYYIYILLLVFFIFCFGFLFASCFSKDPKKSVKDPPSHLHTVDGKFDSLSPAAASVYTAAIEQYYNEHLEKGFNGAILVAKNGHVLFEQYKGYANFITRDSINEHTPFHLASISKTFTGRAVLKLWEEGGSSGYWYSQYSLRKNKNVLTDFNRGLESIQAVTPNKQQPL